MSAYLNEAALAVALERALDRRASPGTAGVMDVHVAELVEVAHALESTASGVVPSAEFREAARRRLRAEMGRTPRRASSFRSSLADRIRMWVLRVGASLAALSFAGAAAASASASALPGDALYPFKQATEAVALQLATTDPARQDTLLRQADTRLDEAARLLDQGRAVDAAATVARYDETVASLPEATGAERVASNMGTNEVRLQALLQTAPSTARPGLERALVATQHRLGHSTRPAINAEVVTPVGQPTSAPTPAPAEPAKASSADDRHGREPEPSRAAEADGHATGHEAHRAPEAEHGRGAAGPTEVTSAAELTSAAGVTSGDVESEPTSSDRPDGGSDAPAIRDDRAPLPANPHAPGQPQRASGTPRERSSAPRSQGGGRNRP
jgi:hypothetical protein